MLALVAEMLCMPHPALSEPGFGMGLLWATRCVEESLGQLQEPCRHVGSGNACLDSLLGSKQACDGRVTAAAAAALQVTFDQNNNVSIL